MNEIYEFLFLEALEFSPNAWKHVGCTLLSSVFEDLLKSFSGSAWSIRILAGNRWCNLYWKSFTKGLFTKVCAGMSQCSSWEPLPMLCVKGVVEGVFTRTYRFWRRTQTEAFDGGMQSFHRKLPGRDLGEKMFWPHFVPCVWSPTDTHHWLNPSGSLRGRELLMQSYRSVPRAESRWREGESGSGQAEVLAKPSNLKMLVNNLYHFCQIWLRVNPNVKWCCLGWLCLSLCIFSISRNGHSSLPSHLVFFCSSDCSCCKNQNLMQEVN